MRHRLSQQGIAIGLAIRQRPWLDWTISVLLFPLLNALLSAAVRDYLPFFMDSIFTAIAASLFGLGQGLAVAVLTNGWNEALSGFPGVHLPFALCGATTALITYAFLYSGRGAGLRNWMLCVAAVTLSNSLLGALIASFVFGGATEMNLDNIVAGFGLFTDSVFTAAFLARLPINIVDKAIAVLPAFAIHRALAKAGDAIGGGPSRARD